MFICNIWRQFSGLILVTQRPKLKSTSPYLASQRTLEGKYGILYFFLFPCHHLTKCSSALSNTRFVNALWLAKTLAILMMWFWCLNLWFFPSLFAGTGGGKYLSLNPCVSVDAVFLLKILSRMKNSNISEA